jgi:hypothetical protein
MAIMKDVNPTKGNPRPVAKPIVPTKAPTRAPTKLPSLNAGAPLLQRGPATLTEGDRFKSMPGSQPLLGKSYAPRPQGGVAGGLAGLERSMGTGFGLSNNPAAMNALGSADRAVQQQIQALINSSLPDMVSGVTSGTSPIQRGARGIAQGASGIGQDILNWLSEMGGPNGR